MKFVLIIIGLLALLLIVDANSEEQIQNIYVGPTPTASAPSVKVGEDPLNATYLIEGEEVTLVAGKSESTVPNSSASVVTQNFNQPVYGELNNDGADDSAFMIVRASGGSGTFYYAVASIKTDEGYVGTNGILLGDRIAPQNTQIKDEMVIANYAVVPAGAPQTAQPSQAVSKYMIVKGFELIETASPN